MNFHREEAYDHRALREEREVKPARPQFSLRTLLLVVVPVAILSLLLRWLMDHGLALYVIRAGMTGALMGLAMALTFALLFYPYGKPNEKRSYLLSWSWYGFCAGVYGRLHCACLLGLTYWFSKS